MALETVPIVVIMLKYREPHVYSESYLTRNPELVEAGTVLDNIIIHLPVLYVLEVSGSCVVSLTLPSSVSSDGSLSRLDIVPYLKSESNIF